MTIDIHPTAIIHPTAQLGSGVIVGPYSLVGADVVIGEGTKLASHVVIEDRTILGAQCTVGVGSIIGGAPQDLNYGGEPTRVRIGNHTLIREHVTVNRATGEGLETVLGNHCFLMTGSHIGHNGRLGNHVVLANMVLLGGHVVLDDYVFVGGSAVMHQFVHAGRMAFVGGASACRQDIPPFSMNDGRPAAVHGINSVGLKRRGLSLDERQRIKRAFFHMWFSGLNQTQALDAIAQTILPDPYVQELVDFIQSSKRGICHKTPVEALSSENDDDEALLRELSLA